MLSKPLSTCVILFFMAIFLTLPAHAAISGSVSVLDNEKTTPLTGVPVSDGLEVTLTGADGRFTLPDRDGAKFVFLTLPAGYRAEGEFYRKIAESAAYDFTLAPYTPSAGDDVSFIHITDVETAGDNEIWPENLRRYALTHACGFIINTGDICYRDGMKHVAENINSRTMGVPVFYSAGNHDLVSGPTGEAFFEDLFGPVFYSLNAGRTHFVVLPMLSGDARPSYNAAMIARWLKNDLAHKPEGYSLVVFCHDHWTFGEKFSYGGGNDRVDLNAAGLLAWIYGHYHVNHVWRNPETGILTVCSSPPNKGGIDHAPSNYFVYRVDGEQVASVRPRVSYVDHLLHILSPATVDALAHPGQKILVQAYDAGCETQTVSVTGVSTQGEVLFNEILQPATDWTWTSAGALGEKLPEHARRDGFTLKAKAVFADGQSREATQEVKPGETKKRWATNVGGNLFMGTPVVTDDAIYVATCDDGQRKACAVVCLDFDGNIRWRTPTANSVKHHIALSDGVVLATDTDANAYGLDAATGKILWQKPLGLNSPPGFVTGTCTAEGVYYTGLGKTLHALDAKTGETLWRNSAWGGGEGTPAAHTLIDGRLYVSANWRGFYAHDARTGKHLWTSTDSRLRFRGSAPVKVDGLIMLASNKGLQFLNPETGAVERDVELPHLVKSASTPCVTDTHVWVGSTAAGLIAVDRATWQQDLRVPTGENLFYTSPYTSPKCATVEAAPIVVGDLLIFGALDGILRIVDISGDEPRVIHEENLGAPILAACAHRDGTIYVTDFGGNVTCVRME